MRLTRHAARPLLAALAVAALLVAWRGPARSSVAEGAIERSFRVEGILREESRQVGREIPGLADPLAKQRIVAAFEHDEIDALATDDQVLPDPEEFFEYEDGFISTSGTYVELSRRDALQEQIPVAADLYFSLEEEGRFEDESDPPPPPMNYTLLDEMIEARERMTARLDPYAGAPEGEKEIPAIGRFLDESEKPVLKISKKLEKTIKGRDERRKGRDVGDEEALTIQLPRSVARGDAFRWPVVAKRISSRFGWRIHPIRRRKKFHNGVDLAANYGRPIIACGDGVVEYSGWKSYYGKTVIIRHPNGLKSLYAHCSKLNVSRGQKVKGGTRIAAIGSTGLSTGPHLHFGIMKSGQFVNPLPFPK